MTNTTDKTPIVALDALIWLVSDDRRDFKVKIDSFDAYLTSPPEFLIENRIGEIYIARLTGRTIRQYGMDCPTIERFAVRTIAIDGVLYGTRDGLIDGLLAVRPEYITLGLFTKRNS